MDICSMKIDPKTNGDDGNQEPAPQPQQTQPSAPAPEPFPHETDPDWFEKGANQDGIIKR